MEDYVREKIGKVQVADEVFCAIAGLAATEVKGVSTLGKELPHDMITRSGIKELSKCVKIDTDGDQIAVRIAISVTGDIPIPKVSTEVTEHVRNAIEAMTGMTVSGVEVNIIGVHA